MPDTWHFKRGQGFILPDLPPGTIFTVVENRRGQLSIRIRPSDGSELVKSYERQNHAVFRVLAPEDDQGLGARDSGLGLELEGDLLGST